MICKKPAASGVVERRVDYQGTPATASGVETSETLSEGLLAQVCLLFLRAGLLIGSLVSEADRDPLPEQECHREPGTLDIP